ncbi:alpha-amylase family glycosyl hydrolase [Lachnoclostridium edouardi]|uniref:alpha-amylase family glycosyl hydrolase n=1 Tax=Lachnoclostridium edouardi TaxID=1926283 RepID=UPI000C7ADC1F|nr:alpha-amylase family glycosyl hydrolase [Lachnoclostridium edouardi]
MKTWYEKAVFYHMYPLGMTGAPHQNTQASPDHRFNQLDKWIPHICGLSCTAVYIGPLFESSTHGYDTIDFKKVDRRLGSNNDFQVFVYKCHLSGIKVIVDGVFNHTGRSFFAFQDIQKNKWNSPYKDWYKGVNFDCQSPMGDPFSYEAWHGIYDLPALNLQNPQVKQYLFDVIRFWIDTFDIDGIRLDCANVLDFTFMKEMRQMTDKIKPDFWLMGEVIHGEYSRWVNGEMLHSVTNYELHKSLYSGLNDHNFFEIAHNVKRLEAIGRDLYTFLDNHDEDRIASKLKDSSHLYLAYFLLMTLPGIPSIYYGGEWGVEGLRTKDSDYMLRPAIDIEKAETMSCPLTNQLQTLCCIHNKYSHFHHGLYKELLLTNRQYAFLRQGDDSIMIVAANNDSQDCSVSIPVPDGTEDTAVNIFNNTPVTLENGRLNVVLQANDGLIYKLNYREEL